MKRLLTLISLSACSGCGLVGDRSGADGKIAEAALNQSRAYEKLEYLTDRIGPRLAGSAGLDKAVLWTAESSDVTGSKRFAAVQVLLLVPAVAGAAPPTHGIALDGTQEIGALPVPLQVFPNGLAKGPLAEAFASAEHGAPDLILTLYDDSGLPEHAGHFLVPFWEEYSGAHSDVYVGWEHL